MECGWDTRMNCIFCLKCLILIRTFVAKYKTPTSKYPQISERLRQRLEGSGKGGVCMDSYRSTEGDQYTPGKGTESWGFAFTLFQGKGKRTKLLRSKEHSWMGIGGGAPGEGEKTQSQTSYYPMEDSKLIDFILMEQFCLSLLIRVPSELFSWDKKWRISTLQ